MVPRLARPAKKARRSVDAPKSLRDTLLQGSKVTAKSKTENFKNTKQTTVNESSAAIKTAVSSRHADVDSEVATPERGSASDEEDASDDDVAMEDIVEATAVSKLVANGKPEEAATDAPVEPSFSEMLLSSSSALIAVDDNEKGASSTALVSKSSGNSNALAVLEGNPSNLSAPHLTSLLTTALQTKDLALLKTCLSPRTTPASLATIRLTIERLPSVLVVDLLGHVADVMHRRPGRAGSLMVWIQWSLVCHGGYIASLCATPNSDGRRRKGSGPKGPTQNDALELLRKLRSLDQVCNERKRNLERLHQLKGKLDLLVAQSKLRRERVEGKRRQHDADSTKRVWIEDQDGDHEVTVGPNGVTVVENVVDVEDVLGIDSTHSNKKAGAVFDSDSSSDGEDNDGVVPVSFIPGLKAAKGKKGKKVILDEDDLMDDDDEDEDSMDDLGGLLDIEAESTDGEGSDEEEDSEEEDEEDGEDLEGEDLEGMSSDDDEDSSEDDE